MKALEFLLVGFGWECSCQQRIIISLALILLALNLFSHFLILFELINDFTIHLGSISVPSVPFYLPSISYFLHEIISCDTFIGIAGSNLTWAFSTLLLIMSHSSTVIACSFAVMSRLVAFLPSLIPLIEEAFRLIDRNFNQFSASF